MRPQPTQDLLSIRYRTAAGVDDRWPQLGTVLSGKTIDWDLIAYQYDQMVKYATALRPGTTEAEQAAPVTPRSSGAGPTPQIRSKGLAPTIIDLRGDGKSVTDIAATPRVGRVTVFR